MKICGLFRPAMRFDSSWFFHLLDRRYPTGDLIRRGKIQNLALVFVRHSIRFSRFSASPYRAAVRRCIRSAQESILLALPSEVKDFFWEILGPLRTPGSQEFAPFGAETPCMSTTTYPPTDYTAVLSAIGGLTAGFGMGPGDPSLHGRAHAGRCPHGDGSLDRVRATLTVAWRLSSRDIGCDAIKEV